MMAGEPNDESTRPSSVTEALVAAPVIRGGPTDRGTRAAATAAADPGWDADAALTLLFTTQRLMLERLAYMLVHDAAAAEDIVQDVFVAMHRGWRRLRDEEKAKSYLSQAVVNRSRSVLRHRGVVERNAPKPAPDMPSAEHGAMVEIERQAVIAALHQLPRRQREVIVLRYYSGRSETQIATMLGISNGAVKSHTSRGMAALRALLEQADSSDGAGSATEPGTAT